MVGSKQASGLKALDIIQCIVYNLTQCWTYGWSINHQLHPWSDNTFTSIF